MAAIDRADPRVDRLRVEEALAEHFRRLELDPRPVRWVPDVEQGYLAAYPVGPSRYPGQLEWARRAADATLWPVAMAAAEPPAELIARRAAEYMGHKAVGAERNRSAQTATQYAPLTESELGEPHAWSVALLAAHAALPPGEGPPSTALVRWTEICLPIVDAFESGLWIFFSEWDPRLIAECEVIAVPRPALRIAGDRLHCEDGPAVSWPGGAEYHFPPGIELPPS